jgi:2'-5' RNA ligase
MITHYADNTSQWKRWQQKYQFGALMIFPPDPPLSRVNELRAKYDGDSAAVCDAHISLTVPLPRPVSQSHWNELKAIASNIKSFAIHYGPLKNYLPHPGVCLAIEPQTELDRLRTTLEGASIFEGIPERKYPFSAHMTIAEFITVEQTKDLMIKLNGDVPEGDFICDSVSYAVPDDNFHFAERARLQLT